MASDDTRSVFTLPSTAASRKATLQVKVMYYTVCAMCGIWYNIYRCSTRHQILHRVYDAGYLVSSFPYIL